MICPNCGKEAADGALFCTGCGGRLDNLPKQEKMTASENSNNDDSSVMDAVFTSDAADGTHETNSGNTVAENSDVAGADENSGERMSAANDNNLKAQPANRISTEKNKKCCTLRVCSSGSAAGETVKYMELYLAQAPVHDSDCEYSCAVRFCICGGHQQKQSFVRACRAYRSAYSGGAFCSCGSAVLPLHR